MINCLQFYFKFAFNFNLRCYNKVPARTLVVCPAIVVQQWKDEVEAVPYNRPLFSQLSSSTR
jgi:hypothetical protein